MALLDTSRLETLTPSQFFTFTLPNPLQHDCYLRSPLLRFAVLDSPNPNYFHDQLPIVAAMIVPAHRESDWIFSTESGQRHLLLTTCSNVVSRFVLIGNLLQPNSPTTTIYVRNPSADEEEEKRRLEMELNSLVIALHPKVCFQKGLPVPQFFTYEDTTLFRTTVNTYSGPVVGEFLVEDVQVETKPGGTKKDFRRRLRFKRMPNLIQTEVPLIPTVTTDGGGIGRSLNLDMPSLKKMSQVEFKVDTSVLILPYLNAMASAISLIASHLDSRLQVGVIPRVLCLGVGGGALLSFINTQLGFQVFGVDCDTMVLAVAAQCFGLKEGNSLGLFDGDAIKLIETVAFRLRQQNTLDLQVRVGWLDSKFDVLMVDLDASDPRYGICAPPPNFATEPVFRTARSVLTDHGVFVMNVVPLNPQSYLALLHELKRVFNKVYEIDVQNEDNKVLAATLSTLPSHDCDNALSKKLRQVISEAYIDSIKEV